MAPFYTFSPKTTTISFSWPKELTGLERVALSAQGDLQRVLSAFFARPIVLALIHSHSYTRRSDGTLIPLPLPNPSAISSVSPEFPIVQNRQVHLQCGGKVVCTATSTVKIYSPRCAHLFLEEKYGIGQLFSKLEATPSFELLSVGIGGQDMIAVEKGLGGGPLLWRKYRLSVPEIECEILEVFTSRDMFVRGQSWLDEQGHDQVTTLLSLRTFRRPTTNTLLWFALFSVLIFEFYIYLAGSPRCV
ncbi:hypothetical protein DFH09DRAFT_1137480 [Mycena vulgaris]|nr:hypothetical protein DFH09DRAFT_1137480 [Mycena vulgaris]